MENANSPSSGQDQSETMKGKSVGMAIVAYFIFFLPLFTETKNDPFVKYHVKQGLTVFLAGFAASIAAWIPVIRFFDWILNIAVFILFIIGLLNAANGKEKPLPLIGRFGEKLNF